MNLPQDLDIDEHGLDDPEGQRLALIARLSIGQDTTLARRWLDQALARPAAALPWAAARIELDATHTLRVLGDRDGAIAALNRAENRLKDGELSLMELEAARLGRALKLDGDYAERVQRLNRMLKGELAELSNFTARWS